MKSCNSRFVTIIIVCIGFLLVSGIYFASSCYALEGTDGETSVTEDNTEDAASGKVEPYYDYYLQQNTPLTNTDMHVVIKDAPGDLVFHFSSDNPDVLVFPDEKDSHFIGTGPGWAKVTIRTEETDKYVATEKTADIYLYKYAQNINGPYEKSVPFSAGGYQMETRTWHIYTDHSVSSSNEQVATVTKDGYITFHKPGSAVILVEAEETDLYNYGWYRLRLTVTDDRTEQSVTGPSDITVEAGKTARMDMSAQTELSYSSSNTGIVTVDSTGTITGKKEGKAVVTVTASDDKTYKSAVKIVTVTVRDYKAEAARENAAADKAKTAEAAGVLAVSDKVKAKKLAKKLKKPKVTVKRLRKKNKISWKKVKGASGYVLYVKYPGARKYVRAVTKGAKIKSVTHKGLTRKKTYKYKLRAYVKVGNAICYGPYSRAVSGRVR